MREIKFRANRFGIIGKVLEINFLTPEKGFDFLLEDKNGNTIREWGKNLDLMQFTGLHDKNGKEIYEGDIIEGGLFVMYFEELGLFAYNDEYKDTGSYLCEMYQLRDVEVIGNIYENPELLNNE